MAANTIKHFHFPLRKGSFPQAISSTGFQNTVCSTSHQNNPPAKPGCRTSQPDGILFRFQGVLTTHLARGNLSQGGCIVNRHRASWGRQHTIRGIAWLVTLCLLPGSTEGREAGYESSRPTHSAHLLRKVPLLRGCTMFSTVTLETKCSNTQTYGGHFTFKPYMMWSACRSRPLPPQILRGLKVKQKWRC